MHRNFKNVIPYRRWSTLEQGNSDRSSDDRQIANTHAFCREMGWTITDRVAVDAGRSAFTGENLTKGYLGKLTTKLLTGAIDPTETIIVVEELDRLSRQPPGRMTAWIQPLLALGVHFAVANTRQIINEATMNDFGQFVSLMSQAFSNYEFSRKQQGRGTGAWNKRRDAAREGRNLSRHRARGWLAWDFAAKRYIELPERVWLIHEMFRLHVEDKLGKGEIAKTFNARAVADPRYRAFSSSRKQPELWTPTAIGRILHDPAVTGFIQYHNNPRGAEKRIPIGEPVKVYPEVVTPELFARANEKRHIEQQRHKGRGKNISNLLGPLAGCALCGGTMQPLGSASYKTARDGTRRQHYYLYCNTAKTSRGTACSNMRGWPYGLVEKPILDRLLNLAVDDHHFRTDDVVVAGLEGNVVRLQRQIEDQKRRAKVMLSAIGDEGAMDYEQEAYETARRNILVSITALSKAQAELSGAKGMVSPTQHIVRVSEMRDRMSSPDPDVRYQARLIVKSALRGIIDQITFYPDADPFGGEGGVFVELIHGIGSLLIRSGEEVRFWESEDTRLTGSRASLAYAKGDADATERIESYRRRRAA